jgi:hypothetical protein
MKIVKLGILILGVLVTLVGLNWMGQGSGYFPYPSTSFMVNQTPWILRGAIVSVVGRVGIFLSRRL